MCSAGAHQQGEVCSQTASCALTTTTTASSPEETVLYPPAVPAEAAGPAGPAMPAEAAGPAVPAEPSGPAEAAEPAELLPCTQGVALSQLSTVTAGDVCASKSVQPPQAVTHRVAAVRGKLIPQRSESANKAGAQTVMGHMGAGNLTLTKAGLLCQILFDPPALLTMLGINAKTAQSPQLQTCTAGTQGQAGGVTEQTPTGLSAWQGPKAARAGTAADSLAREATEAAAEHALTNDQCCDKNHAVREVQRQREAVQGLGGSLMTMLGLGGVAGSSGGNTYGQSSSRVCEEEGTELNVGKMANVALHVVEVLLDAVLTQPQVSSRHVIL
ncbi:hypothetical protein ABBQ32_003261 [Trebouxia sp. C0010 RCD-2024]